MSFKKIRTKDPVPDSPEKLILQLPRRKIPGLLLHQGEVLRDYAAQALNSKDVAMQLPTGSGKTLVGLMLGEWRRRRDNMRVVYVCPTNQLVNQVVLQSRSYGLSVQPFTGRIAGFDPGAKTDYQRGDKIAVTNYAHIFNTNPFFENPDLLILDDAHSAEDYIANHWSLRIDRRRHATLHNALSLVLKRVLPSSDMNRMYSDDESLRGWVDKVPTPVLAPVIDELDSLLSTYTASDDLRHSWSCISGRLHACNLFFNNREILIRPVPAHLKTSTFSA